MAYTKDEAIELTKSFLRKAFQRHPIISAYLFGSYVKGIQNEYSDIDIAVISEDFGKDKTKEEMFLFRLGSCIDPRLEPIPLTPRALQEDTWVPLIYEIKTKGMEIPIK